VRPRTLLLAAVALAAVVVAVMYIVRDEDNERTDDAAKSAAQATVAAIKPAPFKAGMTFREPPSLRSSGGYLRGTIVAKNGTIRVSGIKVRNTQSYGVAGAQRGLLGPTLRVQPGDQVDLVLDNQLVAPSPVPEEASPAQPVPHGECHDTTIKPGDPQPTNLHFHGFHVTPRNRKVGKVTYYGDNVLVCLRRGRSRIRFTIPSTHDQGTFWYHAHLHGVTDDQVFRGLAGMIVVGDSRRYLPTRFARVRTRLLSLKDIQVTGDDRPAIPTDHDWMHPTHRTVNGLVNPKMTMRPGETQLWRVGNSSSALWYRVALMDGERREPFRVVSTDGNPLVLPQRKTQVLLGPGQRVDILVRARRAGTRVLKTLPFNQGRLTFGEDVLATVRVAGRPTRDLAAPDRRRALPTFPSARGPERTWIFSTYFPPNADGQFLIDGRQFRADRVDARPRLGTTERWTLLNTSTEWHPIHIHQDDYRVLQINGRRVNVRSDQDVIPLPPISARGVPGRVVLDMPFQRFSGNFVMHCHILDHEDAGMMARIDVRR
jgi:suppressor of ftsI